MLEVANVASSYHEKHKVTKEDLNMVALGILHYLCYSVQALSSKKCIKKTLPTGF